MESKTIDIQESIPNLTELLVLVTTGTEIILTDGQMPVARLSPIEPLHEARQAGLHVGAIEMNEDFDAPLPDDLWLEQS